MSTSRRKSRTWTIAGDGVASAGAKIERGGDSMRNRGRVRFRAFISAARRSNSDFVTGPAHRSINGSVSTDNTPFVGEKASGPDVDDNVVAHRNKEPQISTDFNRASDMPLARKHLKTDLLCCFAWGVWGSIPHCCKAIDSPILSLDLLRFCPLFDAEFAAVDLPKTRQSDDSAGRSVVRTA
jgi:hypothetical protein